MKLVVEIDKETYKDIKKGKVYSSFRDVPQESVLAIANGTPIPDNATVCDIEQIRDEIEHEGAMFPDGEFFVSIDRINEIIDNYAK